MCQADRRPTTPIGDGVDANERGIPAATSRSGSQPAEPGLTARTPGQQDPVNARKEGDFDETSHKASRRQRRCGCAARRGAVRRRSRGVSLRRIDGRRVAAGDLGERALRDRPRRHPGARSRSSSRALDSVSKKSRRPRVARSRLPGSLARDRRRVATCRARKRRSARHSQRGATTRPRRSGSETSPSSATSSRKALVLGREARTLAPYSARPLRRHR